ncbi:helix-turn-helix transcriptional regulator [Actinokineospora inagensis]|uniref:helix-turn-helix transcriptional regulator n=1 Tax=Actinokineospora inagensis TaxID=103730 RepID=UPI0024803574|nr:LuxR family transcriptional regulator [Actinokineospora inagensis]
MLEREGALGAVRKCVVEAGRGDGRLVLLAGEAGVGKSTLVGVLRGELGGVRWSWSACDGLFVPRPLGPLFDLADQLGGDLWRRCVAGGDREELFRALVREVAAPGVVDVVVVEDIHWADEATLDLLRFLSRRLRDAAVVVIATYRDDEGVSGALRVALGDLAAQPSTRRVRLAPLSLESVRVLVEGSGFSADRAFELTGGNPFYVAEMLHAGVTEVPVSARDVVLARAARLGGAARGYLDVAAMIGAKVEVSLLAEVCPDLVALDELPASGLLVVDGRWFRFRHEIARLAVAQAIPAHRAHSIHQRLLTALCARGCADEARMAFHAEECGDGEAVLRYAPAAARRAARLGSHHEAAAQFERALRFADRAGLVVRAELYEGLADESALLGRLPVAEEAAEKALASWREAGDRLREGAALARLSRIRWALCRGRDAVVAARASVSVLERVGSSVELAEAYATLANQRMLHADYDTATALARRAQKLAAQFGVTDVLSDALNTEAASRSCQGLEWTALMRRALDIALAGRHQQQAARAHVNLSVIAVERWQFVEAEQYLAEGIEYCDDHGLATYAIRLRGELANLYERTGRWGEALAVTNELFRGVDQSPVNRLCGLVRLGVIRARRGEPGVWECLDEASAIADGQDEPPFRVFTRLARAEAHWLAGDGLAARREAESAEQTAGTRVDWHRGAVAVWLRRTGSERSTCGDVAEPHRDLLNGDTNRAVDAWNRLGCPYEAGMALLDSDQDAFLRQAFTIFTELGASAAVMLTRRALRRLGARAIPAGPRTATRAHPLGLTRREHEVLGLLAEGHTNAQIGGHLCISAKTVDHHVSAILAKLGVPDRASAGRVARRALA